MGVVISMTASFSNNGKRDLHLQRQWPQVNRGSLLVPRRDDELGALLTSYIRIVSITSPLFGLLTI